MIFVMPVPHTLSCSWRSSHFCSLCCIHVRIPNHCASSRVACACTKFVTCPPVQCSCISTCACCRIVLSMWRIQLLGVTGALLLLLHFPCLFLSIGSTIVEPAVTVGVGVAAVIITIATCIGTTLLLSPTSPISRLLLSLTLASVITPVKQTSLPRVVLVIAYSLADGLRNHIFSQDCTQLHSIAWL
jgi:hypothetical protein